MSKKKPPTHKKRPPRAQRPRGDASQIALAVVEQAVGGKLVDKPASSRR